ncbi:MAG TPA: alpha/beta hydrolase, partial [Prolixibacteraceae bacterium]|nr:alpha/beta hydrolase [Prolixibacteraceae bacterium]
YVSKELPPMVIITGDRELEMLGRYEENAYFVRMMKLVGNKNIKLFELEGLGHSEMKNPGLYLMLKELKKMLP